MFCFNTGTIVVLAFTVGIFCNLTNAKFPTDPKPCKYEDHECILKLVNYFVNEKSQGDSAVNLVKIDPLTINKINIKQGADSPVNIDLTFIKNELHGLAHSTTYKVKGFGKDLTKKHEIHIKIKKVELIGDYTISGRVLVLPINGNGKSNITMVNADLHLYFTGTPLEKDGATFMKINHLKLDADPERIHYEFGNLFNGDKALGDNMNLFLNENWKEIYAEVRESFASAFGQIFQSVLNNVFTKYPYETYFEE